MAKLCLFVVFILAQVGNHNGILFSTGHGVEAYQPVRAMRPLPRGTQFDEPVECMTGSSLRKILPEVIDGVHLPDHESIPQQVASVLNINSYTSGRLIAYLFKSRKNNSVLLGTPKAPDNSLDFACQNIIDVEGLRERVPAALSSSYRLFGVGNKDHVKELTLLLKTNPFMASALTASADGTGGFELISYGPNGAVKKPSRYCQFVSTLTNGVGHRVNFKFTPTMEYESFTVYDDLKGQPIATQDAQTYASSAIYNLLFYASCTHATIHTLHFLLTSALECCSRPFDALHEWAEDYDKHVALKYFEVGQILIKDAPNDLGTDTTILTGKDGFGSSQAIRPLLKEMLNDWGTHPTAFMDTMMNISPQQMADADILTEFRKHVALLEPFADNAVRALQEIDAKKLAIVERKMTKYLKECGDFQSNVASLKDWLILMGVSGIVHGATLSYTRFIGTAHVSSWRNKLSDVWDEADLSLISSGLGTVTGVDEGRHVMTEDEARPYADPLKRVLDEYDGKTTALKEAYEKKLIAHPDFAHYGFILSDYCSDGFDGKQLTISTYI
jgi:hypothetical protein